ELSTDYHHTVLKNYLRFRGLASLNQIDLPTACDMLLKQAIEFSYYVHKPDGFIPAINDGDCNSYLPLLKKAHSYYPDAHLQYIISKGEEGVPPAQRSRGFTDSGYYVLRSDWSVKPYGDALYLFFDCAPLGFGSHGHYDALNFEMSAYGHSLVVDPGRYTYSEISEDGINWRKYFKGSSTHNTVVVDGLDQMPYRCGRPVDPEPEVRLKQFVSTTGFDFLHGQVISQQYPVVHERMIYFMLPEYWIVTDQLKAEGKHNYDLYFHLASRSQDRASLASNDVCHIVRAPNLLIAQPKDSATDVTIEQGYVSPEYGIKHKAPIIRFSKQQVSTTAFHTVVYPYRDLEPTLQVTEIPVYQNGRLCESAEASALQINLIVNENTYVDYFFSNPGATKAEYSFADVHCVCRMLFIRRNGSGKIINLQAESASFITLNDDNFLNFGTDSLTLSYANQYLSLTTSKRTLTTRLDKIEGFHFGGNLAEWWMEVIDGNK
ncbi:MAG: alginate lyase family protein, partial [Methyloglobulus sp.]